MPRFSLKNFTEVATLAVSDGFFRILSSHVIHTKIFVWPSQIFYVFSLTFAHHEKVVKKSNDLKNHFFEMFDLTS